MEDFIDFNNSGIINENIDVKITDIFMFVMCWQVNIYMCMDKFFIGIAEIFARAIDS